VTRIGLGAADIACTVGFAVLLVSAVGFAVLLPSWCVRPSPGTECGTEEDRSRASDSDQDSMIWNVGARRT